MVRTAHASAGTRTRARKPECGTCSTRRRKSFEHQAAGRSGTFQGPRGKRHIELEGKRFRISNLNKVYFPESGYTKRDLLAYYYRMADYILPFLKDRPLVLRRYPDGIKGQAFFQKNMSESLGLPDWFQTVPVDSESKGQRVHVRHRPTIALPCSISPDSAASTTTPGAAAIPITLIPIISFLIWTLPRARNFPWSSK